MRGDGRREGKREGRREKEGERVREREMEGDGGRWREREIYLNNLSKRSFSYYLTYFIPIRYMVMEYLDITTVIVIVA